MNKTKAITLIELILAVSISVVVFLGLTAIYLASGRFYRDIIRRSGVEEELILALSHMSSRVMLASTIDTVDPSGPDRELSVNGDIDGGDPSDTSDDHTIEYTWSSNGNNANQVIFNEYSEGSQVGSADQLIAENITDFVMAEENDNYLTISLTAQDPDNPDDAITVRSGVRLRCTARVTP